MFQDEVTLTARAGKGGNGCLSFRREKYVPKGGPNGGNGGNGGDVVLLGDENVQDLTEYSFRPQRSAENGEPGKGSDRHGANGQDCALPVPLGTVVTDMLTGRVATEITQHGQRVRLLKGGQGGKGNAHFKSSVNQAPRRTTPGEAGQEGEYRLELKSIADVGLVGFPNAGKSTLLSELSNARPKTAAYPFTTLTPMIGVMRAAGGERTIRLADIPGLVEGASENRGLGHRFLRHIERCALLLIVLDGAGLDGREPLEDYHQLLREMAAYGEGLASKARLVAVNKIDEPAALENLSAIEKALPDERVLGVSALLGEGLETLQQLLFEQVGAAQPEAAQASAPDEVPPSD
ncbi:MAG: GTPase ObgE [Opitutales bacterium]